MKFSEIVYQRPDMDSLRSGFNVLLGDFESARNAQSQCRVLEEINTLRNECGSMFYVAMIRHTMNTADEFYEKENDFADESKPLFEALQHDFYAALMRSPYRGELESRWGKQLFRIAELQLKTFSPEVIPQLQEENRLASRYEKLKAGAAIPFEGEERNLNQLGPFCEAPERNMRKRAAEAIAGFYQANHEELGAIYHSLVQLRHGIARKLAYKTFTPLGYARMMRSDYGEKEAAAYRRQILTHAVPLAVRLRGRQAAVLGLKALSYYDEPFKFPSGNPTPKGLPQWIVEQGMQMYRELSAQTGEFFQFMSDKALLDLETRKNKACGGYCEYLPAFQYPFIFANFNGTSADIDVLTHEVGHAFQTWMSRNMTLPEYSFPTSDAAEIHSMSMEFFAWPWMELFFGEEADKYRFAHLSDSLKFLPYGISVDEFQHWVYENPHASPLERDAAWRRIENIYIPDRNYADSTFLESGGWWYRQGHIFASPFYYIDYTLAQVCAFEFWHKASLNRQSAWNDYSTLCAAGGSRSFSELVHLANLHNPLSEGTVESTLAPIAAWLEETPYPDA
ncbi:MAG: oligoendopeptidase F [Spirochaeta sp. LUC14_002_19_P3]|nr:MAG: oligoendopeptidase F [Spirochaeta sp. LUC14_002_19_P3]